MQQYSTGLSKTLNINTRYDTSIYCIGWGWTMRVYRRNLSSNFKYQCLQILKLLSICGSQASNSFTLSIK